MPVEFAYAQARAQAQHGRRLSTDTWGLLESSVGLAQFLHHVRGTPLARRVEHFSATTSPHVIEHVLRREWHADVESAAHWVPARWRPAVSWTAGLAELPSIGHLLHGGEPRPWMDQDPALATLALEAAEDNAAFPEAAADADSLSSWLRHWRQLWPDDARADMALERLVAVVDRHGIRREGADAGDWRSRLEGAAVGILRRHRERPVTVFCHLLLCGVELHRLRQGLLQRALFNDLETEAAA
jgi:hypothetical protein